MSQNLKSRLERWVPYLSQLRSVISEQRERTARIDRSVEDIRQAVAAAPSKAPESVSSGDIDPVTRKFVQTTAVEHLPFLPFDIRVEGSRVLVDACASAKAGLTDNTAFFVNGNRFETVEYPLEDENLGAMFSDVTGGGMAARLETAAPDDDERFFRFDQSQAGVYRPGDWRRAIHFMKPEFEQFPFPPDANKQRVVGDTHDQRFRMGGATIFKNIEAYLGELGFSWGDFPSILDWGCGSGRVTRYLLSESGQKVTGVDIDPDNVAWCQENLPGGRFETIPLLPRTQFKTNEFDLVIGISVFTHLKEDVQFAWLDELRRIIRPGGFAMVSVQGPTQSAYTALPPALFREVQQRGFVDHSVDPALNDVIADKDYYRATLYSRDYIVKRWSKYFDIIEIVDAIAAVQDMIVLRRR